MRILAVLAALLLVACDRPAPVEPPPVVPASSIMGIDWTATEIAGEPAGAGITSTLRIEPDGRAYGSGGCNRFFGATRIEGRSLTLGPLGSSRMACMGPRGTQEDRYFRALDLVRRYELRDGRLFLLNAEGGALVVLTR